MFCPPVRGVIANDARVGLPITHAAEGHSPTPHLLGPRQEQKSEETSELLEFRIHFLDGALKHF